MYRLSKVNKPYFPEIYESKCIANPKLTNLTFLIPKTNCLQDTHWALKDIMQTTVLELTARNLILSRSYSPHHFVFKYTNQKR